ncbi:DNA mismatch repair protein MutS [Candidatus Thorarchaeota archaeon]|nr:MAG: DNA mismatch repair protein MutS [Candidatus Thorarchaeota archaeon]
MRKHTPMQRQYLQLKRQYPDCVLLFRLGDFYEMFNEDAKKASQVLDIVLTARGEGVDKWPMCGVPYHSVDGYVAKLLEAGETVAIADQVEDASQAKGLVKRDVVRVVTPGTILESNMLDPESNNYLAALIEHDEKIGIAAVDVSTGNFIATETQGTIYDEKVLSEIARIGPAEVLLPEAASKNRKIREALTEIGARITLRPSTDFSARRAEKLIKDQFGVSTLDGFGLGEKRIAVGACGAVLEYLHDVHKMNAVTISGLRTYSLDDYLILDATTQRNLELIRNARENTTRGTLLEVFSKNATPMGKRKLKSWLLQPLQDIGAIGRRLDSVEELARNAMHRSEVYKNLREVGDLERITSRVVFGTGGARDLVQLRDALLNIPKIIEGLDDLESDMLVSSLNSIDPLTDLAETLKAALIDNPPVKVGEGGMIRDGFNDDLDRLRNSISSDKKWIASLQAKERRRTGIRSLKVGYNKVFGYYIEVTKSNIESVPTDYERKQTLTNAERYIIPELKEKEAAVLSGEERIHDLEYEIYQQLREQVKENLDTLRKNTEAIAVLDVLYCLAETAVKRQYCRPIFSESTKIKITDGRHPAMEMVLGQNDFVPNNLEIGQGGTTLLIVTGPNMGGKSTYMRQSALIVLMAQMGSFVPARNAEIGIVDRIFTRVGAFDDLTGKQSTFMVEMVETANILNNATDKSLVILDEIGRGTSTFDGMALAWAVAEEVVKMKTRTLFATHYHQLTDMAETYHGVKNVHTLAKESGESIVFLYKVVEGGTDKSYGVHVASLAGVPENVVIRARKMLQKLENDNRVAITEEDIDSTEVMQTSLEPLTVDDPLLEKIKIMDLERTTPMDALLFLREIQEELKRRRE